eukprot:4630688-Pyramimonas_sp.AAC.1
MPLGDPDPARDSARQASPGPSTPPRSGTRRAICATTHQAGPPYSCLGRGGARLQEILYHGYMPVPR